MAQYKVMRVSVDQKPFVDRLWRRGIVVERVTGTRMIYFVVEKEDVLYVRKQSKRHRVLVKIEKEIMTLLHAAEYGCLEIVRLFLVWRPKLNVDKTWAMWFAAKHGHVEIVELLLHYGVDIREDKMAIQCAAENKHKMVVYLLLQHGAHMKFLTPPARTFAVRVALWMTEYAAILSVYRVLATEKMNVPPESQLAAVPCAALTVLLCDTLAWLEQAEPLENVHTQR